MMEYNKNYYELLGTYRGATAEEINEVYRESKTMFGKDKKYFSEIKEAYKVLSNPTTKAAYDVYWDATYAPKNTSLILQDEDKTKPSVSIRAVETYGDPTQVVTSEPVAIRTKAEEPSVIMDETNVNLDELPKLEGEVASEVNTPQNDIMSALSSVEAMITQNIKPPKNKVLVGMGITIVSLSPLFAAIASVFMGHEAFEAVRAFCQQVATPMAIGSVIGSITTVTGFQEERQGGPKSALSPTGVAIQFRELQHEISQNKGLTLEQCKEKCVDFLGSFRGKVGEKAIDAATKIIAACDCVIKPTSTAKQGQDTSDNPSVRVPRRGVNERALDFSKDHDPR